MKTDKKWVLFLFGLVLAWLVDFLFWSKTPGISYPIWITLAAAALTASALVSRIPLRWTTIILLVLSVGLSMVLFIRQEPLTRFVAGATAFGALTLAAADLPAGKWIRFAILDHLVAFFTLVAGALSRPFRAFHAFARPKNGESGLSRGLRKAAPILIGLVIALPILAVLTLLLVSADLVFSNQVELFLKFLDLDRLPEYIFRTVFVLILAVLFFGVLLHAIHKPDKEVEPGKEFIPRFLGWIEGTIVLTLVNVLFGLFVSIQVRYLFGGQANISETGFTYSEYARRGFNELVMVTVFTLLIYLVFSAVCKWNQKWQKGIFTGLSLLMFALVMVILASAFTRLQLYENAYGFTRLRTYTHFFIFWLAGLLAGGTLLEVLKKRSRFALLLIIFAAGYSMNLAIINLDGFVAGRNIQRAGAGEEFDGQYLATLSDDALPVMLREYQESGTAPEIKDALGASVACKVYDYTLRKHQPWQSFTLPDSWLKNLQASETDFLSAYPVEVRQGTAFVKVDGAWQECYPVQDGFD